MMETEMNQKSKKVTVLLIINVVTLVLVLTMFVRDFKTNNLLTAVEGEGCDKGRECDKVKEQRKMEGVKSSNKPQYDEEQLRKQLKKQISFYKKRLESEKNGKNSKDPDRVYIRNKSDK